MIWKTIQTLNTDKCMSADVITLKWVSKMEETLDKVIKKLINIKEWYAKNKRAILGGNFSDKTLGKYYSEMVVIGIFMSNTARGLMRVSSGNDGEYDGIVYGLLSDEYLKGTEEWFETMLGRKIVWDE